MLRFCQISLLLTAVLSFVSESRHHSVTSQESGARLFAPEVLSADLDFFALTFTPDGQTFYVSQGQATGQGLYRSLRSRRGGEWSELELVTAFDGRLAEVDLFPSPADDRFFFMSKRPPVGTELRPEQDLWSIRHERGEWTDPRWLGEVNSDARDGFPTVAADGTLYFFSRRPGGFGESDIYKAGQLGDRFGSPTNLGPTINSASWDGLPYISPDHSFLIFFSMRPGGYGNGDLYVSYNQDGTWSEPENLGSSVNSPESDVTPHISPDGRYLFFARPSGSEHLRSIFFIPVSETPLRLDVDRFVAARHRER